MTDRPIIFSALMVRALLDGRKTQTRRMAWRRWKEAETGLRPTIWQSVKPGDRLWVREAHYLTDDGDHEYAVYAADEMATAQHINDVGNIAARHGLGTEWLSRHTKCHPSIHMSRWASRLTLIVTDTRLERVQDISEEDAIAEAAPMLHIDPESVAPTRFAAVWNTLHGPAAWDRNDEVVALTFTVHKCNIDQMERAA